MKSDISALKPAGRAARTVARSARMVVLACLLLCDFHASVALAEPAREADVIRLLDELYPIDEGYLVSGSIAAAEGHSDDASGFLTWPRVIVTNPARLYEALSRLERLGDGYEVVAVRGFNRVPAESPKGYRGVTANVVSASGDWSVQYLTINMNRWLLYDWSLLRDKETRPRVLEDPGCLYGLAVRLADDEGVGGQSGVWPSEPCGNAYGVSFFGKESSGGATCNRSSLVARLDFGLARFRGLRSFVPGEEAVQWLIDHATETLYPELDMGLLQREYAEYLRAGGDFGDFRGIEGSALKASRPGLYAFAVDRFGRGRYAPVGRLPEGFPEHHGPGACPGLLFPGEAVKVAGYFTAPGGAPSIDRITVFSRHHYYPACDAGLGIDRSDTDQVFLGIGHFLSLCRSKGVDTSRAVVEKAFYPPIVQERGK